MKGLGCDSRKKEASTDAVRVAQLLTRVRLQQVKY